jgi:predicted Fe-Mo cluster-binding NifX family protein
MSRAALTELQIAEPDMSVQIPTSATSEAGFLVAVAGQEGGKVDKHFGAVETFLIYDLAGDAPKLIERRTIDELAASGEERRATIVRILADCRVLLVEKVGDAPKQMLAAAGIKAIDAYKGKPVDAALLAVKAGLN